MISKTPQQYALECGLTAEQFYKLVNKSASTIARWCVNNPVLIEHLVNSIRAQKGEKVLYRHERT